MIIYGYRSKEISRDMLPERCPQCGTPHSVHLMVYQKYAHVFWVPIFPLGKYVVSQCALCDSVLKEKNMPIEWHPVYEEMRSNARTPIWTFTGLAVISVVIGVSLVNENMKHKQSAKLILSPHQGDVFEIKMKNNHYTLFKIDEVGDDSVLLRINNYESNMKSGLSDIKMKGDTSFSEEQFAVARAELKNMFEKGEIVSIERQ